MGDLYIHPSPQSHFQLGLNHYKMLMLPPHLAICARSFLCVLILFARPLQIASHPSGEIEPAYQSQTSEPISLAPGHIYQKEISGTDRHLYTIRLSDNQYARLLVEQQGIDIVVTTSDAEGKRTSVDRPNGAYGRESISFITRQGGIYRVEIRTLEQKAPRGRYRISIDEMRTALPRDESRLVAEQVVTEGESLRARKTLESLSGALEKFSQGISLWQALDDSYETAVALYGRCLTHRMLNNNEKAIADCSESATMMRRLRDTNGEAFAQTARAWAYIYLGQLDKAFADFSESLETRKRLGDRPGESFNLLGMGWIYQLRGDYDTALEYFRLSSRVLDEIGDPRGKAMRLAAIGEVYRRTNRPAQAIEHFTLSLQQSRMAGNDRAGEAETLTSIGWCHYTLNQVKQAQDSFTESLPLRRAIGDRMGEAVTLLGLAHVKRRQGDLHDARLHVESALSIVESLRSEVMSQPTSLSFFALVQDYYDFYVDLLMNMQRLDPARGFASAALEISERARARSLLDLLRESEIDVRRGVPIELLERESSLRARLSSARNYQRQLMSESRDGAQATTTAKEVFDLTNALSEIEIQIRQASPQYAELTQSQTLSAAAIQREMDEDTLLLEYSLGQERSFLWAVSPSTITSYELPPRREIEKLAAHAYELLTMRNRVVPQESSAQRRARIAEADRQYEAAAARLSSMLLTPAATQLSAKRLVIVVSDALQLIAFGALPSPAHSPFGTSVPLITNHEIIVIPSASTLAMLRGRERIKHAKPIRLIAILADPVFSLNDERFAELSLRRSATAGSEFHARSGLTVERRNSDNRKQGTLTNDSTQIYTLPRLFRTRWEAEQIAALVPTSQVAQSLDFDANLNVATSDIVRQSRVIHLATHALINDTHPELSGISLSMYNRDGQPQDGFLRISDIFNLRLSADLVVLSACRTALGQNFRGEGLVGLTRAFMYAGVPRVVGSLWSTDDKATAELIVRFYRKMFKENVRPAAALRAAQIEMLRNDRWQAPYFWAGFTLQGEWR